MGYPPLEKFLFPSGPSGQRRADAADAIRCTRVTRERCLKIANDICAAAQRVGFSVAIADDRTHIALCRDGAESRLRVVEPCFRANTDLVAKDEQASIYKHGLVGTGWLEVLVNEHWTSTAVYKERSGLSVAESLPKILAEIERRHAVVVASEEKMRRSQLAIERARSERVAVEKKSAEQRKARDELIAQARRWHNSQTVRTYITAMAGRVSAGTMSEEEYEKWRVWALSIAEDEERKSSSTVRGIF